MSASGSDPEQDARILQAKAFYNKVKYYSNAKKLDAALYNFKEVSLMCPCNKPLLISSRQVGLSIQDIPTPTCHCKDFVSLATRHGGDEEGSVAMYRLATKPCSCGSGISSCLSATHIAALDGMSAVFEAQKAYTKAIQHASLLIIVAPHAPEGYLRMVKNLRLQARASRADATSQCMYILTQAAASIRTFGDKHHEKLKAIRQMLRADPMRRFPVEIMQMVLEYLPYPDLCRALRVSKAMNQACRNPRLWMDLEFVRRWRSKKPRPFRLGVLNDIISNRAQNIARSLTITGMKEFAIDATQLRSILRALPRLESLSLSGSNVIQWPKRKPATEVLYDGILSLNNTFNIICEVAPDGLKVLRLDTFVYHDYEGQPITNAKIHRIADILVEMSFTNVWQTSITRDSLEAVTLESRVWPKLEKLTIKTDPAIHFRFRPTLNIPTLVSKTPSLKDMTGHEYTNVSRQPLLATYWNDLERLSIRPVYFHGVPLASPGLRSLEVLSHGTASFECLFRPWASTAPTDVWLANLEHFYCKVGVPVPVRQGDLSYLERIRPSCTNGTLRSLCISFNLATRDALDEVLNKPAIQTLSCEDISMSDATDSSYNSSTHDALLDWVDTFPNLRTVGAYPSHQKDERAWTIVARLLKRRPDISTIYTNVLFGVYRDELLERADKIGVKIIHADRVPEPVLKPLPPAP